MCIYINTEYWLENPLKFKRFKFFYEQLPEVLFKKDVPKNYAKFTGKHLRQNLFSNKGWPVVLYKKEILAQLFSCEFCQLFKNTFF